MGCSSETITRIEDQWRIIVHNRWNEKADTKLFWIEVYTFKDALNNNLFIELAEFAISVLILPHSNADEERAFSQISLIKSKLRD